MSQNASQATASKRWPAIGMAVIIMAAFAFSFSPRPAPYFEPTQVNPQRLLSNGVARSGDRVVVVGEQGHILYADSEQGPWTKASVEPQRGSTFTQVSFIDDTTAIAVGHDGWIVRSEDGGENWTEVMFNGERSEPLLAIAGPFEGVLHTVGGFGLYLRSSDGGLTWQETPIEEEGADDAAVADDDDPFAGFESGPGDMHLNALVQLDDGTLLLVGEAGLLARSRNGGETWTVLDEIYTGSFFGALALPDNAVLVYGMRGNAFRSTDGGDTWQRSETPQTISLFGGRLDDEGRIILVGGSNSVLVSDDGGASFREALPGGRAVLADVLPLSGGAGWLTVGESGVRVQTPPLANGDGGDRS
jgi:photosystem II stability/assembly factor-like uncharacterized protein